MTDGYEVTIQDLINHAGDLRAFANNVREAKGSATDPMVYGVIGVAWGAAMNHWSDDARIFADKAAGAAEKVADELVKMAKTYDEQEETAAANLRRTGEDVP